METNLGNITRIKIMIPVVFCTLLEFYDFTILIHFMRFLKSFLFPHASSEKAFLYTILICLSNFFIRPIAGFFWGYLGDKRGRVPMLIISITMMAITVFIFGVFLSPKMIGIVSPALLILLRILQGISFAGGFSGAMCFALEYAPQEKRGLYVSWIYTLGMTGLLLGSILLGFLLTNYSPEGIREWGWGIPVILGTILFVIVICLRRQIPHSLLFLRAKHENVLVQNPVRHIFRRHFKEILTGFFLGIGPASMVGIAFMYISPFISKFFHYSLEYSFCLNFFLCLLLAIFTPIMGSLSDKIGRKYILRWGLIVELFLAYPLYYFIEGGHVVHTWIILFFFGVFGACILSGSAVALTELFPTNVRYTGICICSNFSYGICIGILPLITIFWSRHFDNPPPLRIYLIFCMFISLFALWRLKESYQRPLDVGSTE